MASHTDRFGRICTTVVAAILTNQVEEASDPTLLLNSLSTTTQNVASFSFLCQWKTDPIASKNREMQSASVFRCKFCPSAFFTQELLSSSMDSTHNNLYVVPLCLTNTADIGIRKKPPKLLKYMSESDQKYKYL